MPRQARNANPHPIAEAIKNKRIKENWDTFTFAREAGVSQSAVTKIEAGALPPSKKFLASLEANIGLRVYSHEILSHSELGTYSKHDCKGLIGDYLVVRQHRQKGNHEEIITFPAKFEWCDRKPGLKFVSKYSNSAGQTKDQEAYVSITDDGTFILYSNVDGIIFTTFLRREKETDNLYGMRAGLGQIRPGQMAIITQVVAYLNKKSVRFTYNDVMTPSSLYYAQCSDELRKILEVHSFMIPPPGMV